jgi:hypothetical protein
MTLEKQRKITHTHIYVCYSEKKELKEKETAAYEI